MKKFIPILFFLFSNIGNAQPGKEAWHWRFGVKGGIDFSSGSPAQETGIGSSWPIPVGCASISDPLTGQYLFSVAGTKIFNKNNVPMANGYGMLGDYNATQQLIVPKPDSANIYYVFTVDKGTNPNAGIHFSEVDMSKQGGLGQVTIKNQVLTPSPTTEKITAVRHCNGIDYWVITHPANSNAFNAYLLSSSGLNTSPIVSHAGTIETDSIHSSGASYFEAGGHLKASPNGKKLALGIPSYAIPILEIFDFDNSTGVVSNPITIHYSIPNIIGPWSVSFSPDNSKLYAMPYTMSGDSSYLYQYDLSSGIPSAIISSQQLIVLSIGTWISSELGALQLGSDGKIYIPRCSSDTMAVINNPNNSSSACNFQFNSGLILPGSSLRSGLPNCIDANYAGIQINLPDIKQCTLSQDTIDAGSGFTNYFWSTGASTQTITINSPGKYWVTVTNDQGCTRTDTMEAVLIAPGKKNISACVMDTVSTIQSSALTYNWSDGSTNPVKTFSVSGTYWEDIAFIGGCAVRDSFDITINPLPVVNLGRDSSFCKGDLLLNAQNPNSTYQWSTGETTPSISVKTAGTYWVKVNENNCFAFDTLVVKPELSLFDFVMPNIITPNDDKINDVIDFSKYQFSTFQIQIFNRWGQEIFKSEDPAAIWKPTQDDGTYFYTVQYKIDCGIDSQTNKLKGFITIVR